MHTYKTIYPCISQLSIPNYIQLLSHSIAKTITCISPLLFIDTITGRGEYECRNNLCIFIFWGLANGNNHALSRINHNNTIVCVWHLIVGFFFYLWMHVICSVLHLMKSLVVCMVCMLIQPCFVADMETKFAVFVFRHVFLHVRCLF